MAVCGIVFAAHFGVKVFQGRIWANAEYATQFCPSTKFKVDEEMLKTRIKQKASVLNNCAIYQSDGIIIMMAICYWTANNHVLAVVYSPILQTIKEAIRKLYIVRNRQNMAFSGAKSQQIESLNDILRPYCNRCIRPVSLNIFKARRMNGDMDVWRNTGKTAVQFGRTALGGDQNGNHGGDTGSR